MEFNINYLAVLLAAVGNMVVGMLWYGPLFGKQWKEMMGFTDESMKSMPLSPAQAILGGFITALVMAYVLAHTAAVWSAVDISGALMIAFWTWLGFVAPVVAGSFLWEGRPLNLFLLNAANWLVSLMVMAVILVLMG